MYGMIFLLIECGMMLEHMGSVDTGEGGITRGYPSNLWDHTNVWGDIPLIGGGMMLE